MECSNLGFQLWATAIFLVPTNLKGISSMKLHRDLGVTRKTAWFLAHRIRETWQDTSSWFAWLPGFHPFDGPIEGTPGATVYTDAALAYGGMTGFEHQAVNYSVGEYVRDGAHTNGIESFWSMLKRGYAGVFHQLSAKCLDRYGAEFAGRHNIRLLDTLDMIRSMVVGIVGKRLLYKALVA